MDICNNLKSSFFSRFISSFLFLYSVLESFVFYIISVNIPEEKTESGPVDYIELLKTTEVSEKYWYLESVLKLEEEINRNIELVDKIFSAASENDDIRVVAGIELSKVKLLKKGKLKMFRNLCLVALKEIPPIEGDKEVTVDDLEGFWCLLGIEAEKHRQSVIEIMTPKSIKMGSPCDSVDSVRTRRIKPTSTPRATRKPAVTAETKATMKVNKSNIDERNRKYMERMKKLREQKAKPKSKVQDKENQNPNPISVTSKEEIKLKQSDKVLTRSPRVQWQI